jgi:sulfate adenylyltransferase subunit 2
MSDRLSHLDRLEAESIHIIREVAAECRNPVMLYSIGKDSSVMLHLARKAFHPAPPPFPLMHVDTTWKFREMYAFRDRMAAEAGMQLIVHQNPDGISGGINPFDHGPNHTRIWKTEGLKQALDKGKFDARSAAPAATRRRAAPRSASSPFAPPAMPGTRRTSGPNSGVSTIRG